MTMAFDEFGSGGESGENAERIRTAMGPNMLDYEFRHAIQMLWMMLPKEKRNVDEIERHIRRVMERALRDLREDFDAFFGGEKK